MATFKNRLTLTVDVSLLHSIATGNQDKRLHTEQLNCANTKLKQAYDRTKPLFH